MCVKIDVMVWLIDISVLCNNAPSSTQTRYGKHTGALASSCIITCFFFFFFWIMQYKIRERAWI